MIRLPLPARVAAGLAAVLVDEVRKLPQTALSLPITAASQALQTSMRVQQVVTELAIRGDEVFAHLDRASEQPEWATFDDDEDGTDAPPAVTPVTVEVVETVVETPPAGAGRFALYTNAPETIAPEDDETVESAEPTDRVAPEIVDYLDYDNLTLAQLRARLRTLSTDDLDVLVQYENANAQRPPFLTMLGNRITSARAT